MTFLGYSNSDIFLKIHGNSISFLFCFQDLLKQFLILNILVDTLLDKVVEKMFHKISGYIFLLIEKNNYIKR